VVMGDGTTDGMVTGDIAATGTVTINRSTDGTYADVISGSGSLKKLGNGKLTLSKAQTFTGLTTIEAGTLLLAVDDGLNASNTVFLNAGTLDLGSKQHELSVNMQPDAIVKSGTLRTGSSINVNGNTTSSVTIQDVSGDAVLNVYDGTAKLVGTNTFKSLGLAKDRALYSAEAGKAVTFNGDVTFNTDSTYKITITPAESSKLNSTGTVTLTGAKLVVNPADSTATFSNKDYEIITGNSIVGNFANVTLLSLTGFNVSSVVSADQKKVTLKLASNIANDADAQPAPIVDARLQE